jgi:hypothetical protein
MNIHSTGLGDTEVLVVRPKRAAEMLSIGQTRLFELLNKGEIEGFRSGGGRWISVSSIRAYVERQLEGAPPAKNANPSTARGSKASHLAREAYSE